jgi:DNA repair protein RecN (Recombination protein N)
MLSSLTIRNFVLIEDAVLDFGPGLTVLTGETGAGKTLLTRALGLLVGERAEEGLVGQAAEEATVQAVFDLDESEFVDISEDTAALVGSEGEQIIITRRLSKQGRNRCYINDTAVTLVTLGEVVAGLLSFAGQHEYRRLLDPGYQMAVLDRWVGEDVADLAARYRAVYDEAADTIRRLDAAHETRESRAREIDLLRFQAAELNAARISSEEESALQAEQRVLARAEDILRSAGAAADLLAGEGDGPDAGSLVAQAASHLSSLQGVDERVDDASSTLVEVGYQITELSRALRSQLERVSVDPRRLQEVDERLRLYTDLARKYGGSTETAVAFGVAARDRLNALGCAEEDLSRLEAARATHVARALELAVALSQERRKAAPLLELAIGAQLADLSMVDAVVEVDVRTRSGWEGLRDSGADSVEFLLSANPGQEARSLVRTASGGELSRVLLAIKCALADAGGHETLVFDEVDAGIGGRTAVAVGRKLHELATRSQLILVTHLAPVAALADRHYLIDKAIAGGATVARLSLLAGDDLVEELCRMMGGSPRDAEAMAHARELRDSAGGGDSSTAGESAADPEGASGEDGAAG